MAIAATVTKTWNDGDTVHVIGTLAFSGSYSTGGDTLNWKTVASFIKSSLLPIWVNVDGIAGYKYEHVMGAGSDQSVCKVIVRVATTSGANIGLAEHTAAAYAAGVTGDTQRFHALFILR